MCTIPAICIDILTLFPPREFFCLKFRSSKVCSADAVYPGCKHSHWILSASFIAFHLKFSINWHCPLHFPTAHSLFLANAFWKKSRAKCSKYPGLCWWRMGLMIVISVRVQFSEINVIIVYMLKLWIKFVLTGVHAVGNRWVVAWVSVMRSCNILLRAVQSLSNIPWKWCHSKLNIFGGVSCLCCITLIWVTGLY